MRSARALLCLLLCSGAADAKKNATTTHSVKEQLSTKIYASTESFYVHIPGLEPNEQPVFENLVTGKDVTLTNENLKNRVKVTLVDGAQWGEEDDIIYVVKTVKDGADVWTQDPNSGDSEGVQVAYILATPTIEASDDPLGASAKRLFIAGSGFNLKHTYLTFAPTDLMLSVDYSVTVSDDQLILALKSGKSWGSAGDLKIVAVDTGAGPVEMDVKVATIVASDHPSLAMATIEKAEAKMYASRTRSFTIKGTGFADPQYIGLQGDSCGEMDEDFTVKVKSSTEIELTLKAGKAWCEEDMLDESASAAVPLVVRSVNSDVVLGKGVQVGTLLFDPEIEKNDVNVMNDKTLTIELSGTGFVPKGTVMVFDPPLTLGEDYDMTVEDSMEVDIHLREGKAWTTKTKFPMPLKVVSIDTGAGPVELNGGAGVVVATITKGAPTAQSVTPSHQRVYASLGQRWLVIEGKGFDSDPSSIKLGPEDCEEGLKGLKAKHIGNKQLNLTLPEEGEWCSYAGPLFLRSMKMNKKTISFTGKDTEGVQIAYVLNDPDVEEDKETKVFETHTKILVLDVDGVPHTDAADVLVKLDPSHEGLFTHEVTFNDELVLTLHEGAKWTGRAGDGFLFVKSIDTGAGWVAIGSQIAIVEPDAGESICSDTCEWAADGVCDDEPDDYAMDNAYGDYEDPSYFDVVCEWGSDCTDCGVREPVTPKPTLPPTTFDFGRCDDSCDDGDWANDGQCDDGRPQSFSSVCTLGTDCSDCGPIPSNEQNNNVDVLDARMCTDGLYGDGTSMLGDRCVFPFTFGGVEYNECSTSDVNPAAVRGWCSTTANFDEDGRWGSCDFCYNVNAETEYYYDPYADYYYEYRYAYEEYNNEAGETVKTKTKVQTKVQKTGVVDPHAGQRPSGSSVGGSIAGIFGLALVTGAAFYAYRKFVQATPSSTGGTYSTVSNRDVEMAGIPMRNPIKGSGGGASSTPITPDNFRS